MPLQHAFEEIIELGTDPALDPSYTINSESLWLDTSKIPSELYERNAANTAWLPVGGLSGTITQVISSSADTWTGTVNNSLIVSTSEVGLTVNANGLQTQTVFLPNVSSITNGSFDWWVGAFKKLSSGTFYIYYMIRN